MSLLPMVIINIIVKNDIVIDRELVNFYFAGILPMGSQLMSCAVQRAHGHRTEHAHAQSPVARSKMRN